RRGRAVVMLRSDIYRFTIGRFSCLAIRDASRRYPLGMFLLNLPRDRYEEAMRRRGEDPDTIDLPYMCLLIDTGRQRVLVDTGIGCRAEQTGRLLEHLRAEAVAPESIDMVVLTHGHGDHIGGNLTAGGALAFPNARYVM